MNPTDPPLKARPRPPAQRAPSSRLTALPTPLSPRRQRPSALSTTPSIDHASSGFPSPIWSASIPPDTPPLGMEDVRVAEKQIGASQGSRDDQFKDEREGRGDATPTSSVPFPSTDTARSETASSTPKEESGEGRRTPNSAHSQQFTCILDDGTSPTALDTAREGEAPRGIVVDPNILGQMSREELENMLSEADRIIRDKEQELSVFTAAGEGLLNEYHSLRDRHESLLSRQRSTSGTTVSPLRPSRLSSVSLSPSHARLPSDSGSQRGWRNSLGPSSAGTHHHRRVSSGRVGITSSSSYVFASSTSSASFASSKTTPPQTFRVEPYDTGSPSTSPTALRSHRFTSSNSVASLFAPPPRTVLSPKSTSANATAPHEIEHLAHLNYSLTQRVEELEADSEFAEREGRKKLRRLEKELLALKEDLERSEGRNAALEMEMEKDGEEKGKGRESDESAGTSRSESEEDEEANETFTSTRTPHLDRDELDGGTSIDSISQAPNSPSPSRFLHAPSLTHFRAPGNGVSRVRAVSSTSSMASLPRIPLFDPSLLDAQQDELFNQLIAKIDELQEANEAILEEREDMEEKLEIAREEVRDWMGKCEDLEEQRKIEWECNDRRAIGWLDDSSAAEARRSRFDFDRGTASREGSPTPPSSIRPDLGRSLRNELSGLWSQDSSISKPSSDTIETSDEDQDGSRLREAENSIVVHSDTASASVLQNLNVPRIRRRNPRRTITPISFSQRSTSTADDLIPTGSLSESRLDSKGYADFAKRAEMLEPAWADEADPVRARLEGSAIDKQKLLEAPVAAVNVEEDPRKLRSKKERMGKSGQRRKRNNMLSSIRFGSDEEEEISTPVARRTLALRRLGLEASSRHTSRIFSQPNRDEEQTGNERSDDDVTSVVSSNYDLLESRDNLASNDYYPLTLRARYHPRMLSNMMRDSAIRHVVTLITWIRFLVVLAMALSFAVWQGPRKTLGLVDGRRRLH